MPLTWKKAELLIYLTHKHDLSGTFCCLGRLHPVIAYTYGIFRRQLTLYDREPNFAEAIPDQQLLANDRAFFDGLGYAGQESIDASDFEGATHIVDLNADGVPSHLRERFDVICNNGTLEHIFHVPNVLRNIGTMLKAGGSVIHVAPSNNHMDHGFYQFSPTLFFDYYGANGFDIRDSFLLRYEKKGVEIPWARWGHEFFDPYALESPDFYDGKLDGAIYTTVFVARKTAESTSDRIPQQGRYAAEWEQR